MNKCPVCNSGGVLIGKSGDLFGGNDELYKCKHCGNVFTHRVVTNEEQGQESD